MAVPSLSRNLNLSLEVPDMPACKDVAVSRVFTRGLCLFQVLSLTQM